jgi:hypothetical protein
MISVALTTEPPVDRSRLREESPSLEKVRETAVNSGRGRHDDRPPP